MSATSLQRRVSASARACASRIEPRPRTLSDASTPSTMIASATSTSIRLKPFERDAANDASAKDDLPPAADDARLDRAAEAVGRQRHALRLQARVARQRPRPQRAGVGEARPLAVLVPARERVAARLGLPGDRLAHGVRFGERPLEQRGKPPRLPLGQLRLARGREQPRRGGEDEDDPDYDQHLDQREAARGAHHRLQEPISASVPSPPATPSAPKLKTSISPRSPGLRNW